ncbi:MAG: hypothetical protein IPH05_10255 [Flavobacteriales bacterium]|nr:hypothetical protein [Flavobacteriales bacterium]
MHAKIVSLPDPAFLCRRIMINAKEGAVGEFILHHVKTTEADSVFGDGPELLQSDEEQEFLRKLFLKPFTPTLFVVDDNDHTTYWQQDFIGLRPKKDHVNSTSHMLELTKSFITEQLPHDYPIGKADQIDRSIARYNTSKRTASTIKKHSSKRSSRKKG